jgi:hypothetical protein
MRSSIGEIWPTKFKNEGDFGGFQLPEVRKSSDFYTWFSVCSQKYRRMITGLYFISRFWLIFLWIIVTFSVCMIPTWLQTKIPTRALLGLAEFFC